MKVLRNTFKIDAKFLTHQSKIVRVLVVLFFSEILVGMLGTTLPQNYLYKAYLVFSFGLLLVTFTLVLLMQSRGKFSVSFLMIILFTLLSFLVGLLNGWGMVDILADAGRFIAPFLAYFLATSLLYRLSVEQIRHTTTFILQGLFILFILSVISKLIKVLIIGEPIIQYPDGGIDIELLLVSFFLVAWFYVPSMPKFARFALIFALAFAVSPLLSGSKSGLITVLFVGIFIPFVYGRVRNQLAMIIVFFIVAGWVITNENLMLVVDRVLIAIKVVFFDGDRIGDMSSFTRVIEIKSAFEGLNDSWFYPFSYLLGNGSGALWYTSVDLGYGINDENFRADGGAHHIHSEIIALLFRHGIAGLAIYLVWMFIVCWQAHNFARYCFGRDVFFMSISAAVVVVVAASFLEMIANTSLYGHFYVGMIAAFPAVLSKKLTYGYYDLNREVEIRV